MEGDHEASALVAHVLVDNDGEAWEAKEFDGHCGARVGRRKENEGEVRLGGEKGRMKRGRSGWEVSDEWE